MRRLLLLRHAEAERSLPGAADRDRALVERGCNDARLIGNYIVRHGLAPDRVLVSSAARARETWECAAKALARPVETEILDELYNAAPHDMLATIREIGPSSPAVLAVGHNPGLHEAALMLVAAGDLEIRERLREGLPTCGLAVIDFACDDWSRLHPHSGRLERFVTPKSLEALSQ
jgi:phosphohistidine phosphatase